MIVIAVKPLDAILIVGTASFARVVREMVSIMEVLIRMERGKEWTILSMEEEDYC